VTAEEVEKVISTSIRDRKAMLWVCQRHDLVSGAEPHDYDLPSSAALLRYRDGPSDTDRAIAGLFWECVCGSKAREVLYLRQSEDRQGGVPARAPGRWSFSRATLTPTPKFRQMNSYPS
jgi:hypothetical protein